MFALGRRLVASSWAPWALLIISLAVHVLVTLIGADPFEMVDLKVYVDGAGHLTDGTLYDFLSGPLELPFTYPPFSALTFRPLYWLPWTVTRTLWEVGMIAALPALIYLTLRLLGRVGPQVHRPVESLTGILVTGTAVTLWLEPVRTTFNYGQINLFLAVLVLGGAASRRNWLAGAGVGIAAGIKLVPAISGLYYLLQRRFAAVAWSAGVFAATIGLMALIIPGETRRYFTQLILDPSRTGPVFSAINQSWRGALARFAGDDVSTSWLLACAGTAVVGLWAAWAASRAGDRTAALLAVQFLGLLVSPISWSHHWIWVLPLLVWGSFGPFRARPAVRFLTGAWTIAAFSYLVPVLTALQGPHPVASRPGWQSFAGALYAVLAVATLVVIAVESRSAHRRRPAGDRQAIG